MTDEDKCGMEPQEDSSLNIGEKCRTMIGWIVSFITIASIHYNKQTGINSLVLKSHQSYDQVITKN